MEMSRLTRDGTAEPVSRDQILRHAGDRGILVFIFPVQLTTSRIGNLARLIHTLLYVMTIHTYIEAHTAVVKNVIGFGFDFDFMFYVTTRQARTKLETITIKN